jgi:membrane-bound ClpP family serine protease
MNDYFASAVAYTIALIALWFYTRKGKSGYVRWQWRAPHWILGRLLVVFVMLHIGFALTGIPAAWGYLTIVLFGGVAYTADLTGVTFVPFALVGFVLREWIFWLPSRNQLILRTRKTKDVKEHTNLVGQMGLTISDLKLAGKIEVNGQEFYARSEAGFVGKGEDVLVSSVGDFELVVRRIETLDQRPAPNPENASAV